jgi:hypothetical protein
MEARSKVRGSIDEDERVGYYGFVVQDDEA